MRYLAIDYGKKYIGIAISDENGSIAFPLKTLENKKTRIFKEIKNICREKKVEKIIIGLPLDKKMQLTQQAKIIKNFAKKLENFLKTPIDFENEIFTTKLVEKNLGKKNKRINEAAASLILQTWIDRNINSI